MFRLFDPGLGGLVGVVLAGRAGGSGRIGAVVAALGPQVDALLIAAAGETEGLERFGLPVVRDTEGLGSGGPLAGVHAGLAWSARNQPRARGIVTVAADTRLLPQGFARALAAVPSGHVGVARRGGALQPIFAYWPSGVTEAVAARLGAGEGRVKAVIESLPHTAVDFPEDAFDPALDPLLSGDGAR